MKWLRRMLGRRDDRPDAREPVSQELTVAQRTLKTRLSLADMAIRAAMTEADKAARYRGPERRSHPR